MVDHHNCVNTKVKLKRRNFVDFVRSAVRNKKLRFNITLNSIAYSFSPKYFHEICNIDISNDANTPQLPRTQKWRKKLYLKLSAKYYRWTDNNNIVNQDNYDIQTHTKSPQPTVRPQKKNERIPRSQQTVTNNALL